MPGHWSSVTIADKPATLFRPGNATPLRAAVIYLHAIGQETLADSAEFTRWLDELNLPCVCPAGGYTWWADKLLPEYDSTVTAERHVLDAVLPYVQQTFGVGERAVGLLGISMGGQGALRIAFKHPRLFPAVVGIAPAVEYQQYYGFGHSLDGMYTSKEQCRQDTAPMHIHPSNQPPHIFFCIDPADADWWRGCDRLHEKLNALGVTHEANLTTRAGGHSWAYFDTMAERSLRFLQRGLDLESRRLL